MAWQQAGGVRASIAGGMGDISGDDESDVEEDIWDFNDEVSSMGMDRAGTLDLVADDGLVLQGEMVVEPLGDEPARAPQTLDDRAAISQIRPPKGEPS